MISIKQSFANCSVCNLLDAPSCILETNCEDNLTEVEVVFVSENPGKDEVKSLPPRPLIGKAGKTFRKPFNKYIRDHCKWLLTNCVLCCSINPDGTTGNPDDSTIDLCKENCFNIIETCNPKLIVLMGASPMKAFGLGKTGITNKRGTFFKWNDKDVLLTVHPSFVNRVQTYLTDFTNDIKLAGEFLGAEFVEEKKTNLGKKGEFSYRIPEKFYSEDYKLIDVQFLGKTRRVLFIFRDKDNNKIYHYENDDYVCYQSPKGIEAKKLMPFDDLHQLKISYKEKYGLDVNSTYVGDQKITVKHAQDYYLQSKGEPDLPLNVLYTDIEIYTDEKKFPRAEDADYTICMITNWYQGKFETYVIHPNSLLKKSEPAEPLTNDKSEVYTFKTEKELMTKWLSDLKKMSPDIIAGWNVIGFDLFYIFNRLPKLGIPSEELSKFKEVAVDGQRLYADIMGTVVLDQYRLYRSFTFTQKESYKLGYIAQVEIGKTKLDDGQFFSDLYEQDIDKAISYNIGDVDLLVDLEAKLKHIKLQDELRKICKVSFNSTTGNFGLVDGLMVSFLKEKGLAAKNADIHGEHKIPGAFVKEPIKGVHDYAVDFDFTSLYPSLILTYNIGVNTYVMKFKEEDQMYDFIYNRDKLPDKITMIIDPLGKAQYTKVSKEALIKKVEDNNLICNISGCFFRPHDKEISIYSEVLEYLLSSRKEYKHKMFEAKQAGDSDGQSLNNIRQLVYKVLANSVYGVIANNAFRFYSADLAKSITLGGQESIKTSIIAGNNFVDHLKTGNDYEQPKLLSKQEMYGDVSRSTPFVITGDTDSLFVTYQQLIDKDKKETDEEIMSNITKWNDAVQSFLNDKVIKELVDSHGVPSDRNRLELKNELIIRRGLFLAKKRYSLYVINQEGRDTDEVVYMGLDIKRSDYPSFTKEALKELLDLVLKSEKVSPVKLNRFVLSKEKEILHKIKKGDKSVARPVAFTRELKEYKRVPPGVIAMLNWNSIEYQAFATGSRGYLFKLSGIKLEETSRETTDRYNIGILGAGQKLEAIAIPIEEERLPEYYVPDIKAMLKFAWTDRYEQILDPLTTVGRKDDIMTI